MQAKHISDEVAADDNGITATAAVANNAALVLGGALTSGGAFTSATGGRIIEITSASDDSAIDFTVVGTDVNGDALSQTIDGADGAAVTTKFFKTVTGITAVGDPAGAVITGTTTGAADVISKATCRLHSMDIVSGGTAGVVNFHNGITDGVPGDILFKHRTLGTDNTAPGHITFGGDGILFDQGMYVTYTVGHIDMMNFFFN